MTGILEMTDKHKKKPSARKHGEVSFTPLVNSNFAEFQKDGAAAGPQKFQPVIFQPNLDNKREDEYVQIVLDRNKTVSSVLFTHSFLLLASSAASESISSCASICESASDYWSSCAVTLVYTGNAAHARATIFRSCTETHDDATKRCANSFWR
jgi:hypothetical protein